MNRKTSLVVVAALVSGCIVQTTTDTDRDGDTGSGGSGAGAPADAAVLFVVNNNGDLTSYAGSLDGERAPTTRLTQGQPTSLYQARAAVLTDSGRMLVARQTGAINGYEDGRAATGETPASLIVEGAATRLTTPTSIAYRGEADEIYIGTAPARDGVLVFAAVSGPAFDGEVAPTRSFGPPDRAPHDADGTIPMSVDALAFDGGGQLWLSDTSGDHANQSRILVYADPDAASGALAPDRVLTNAGWGRVEDMAVDAAGNLYLVTGNDVVLRVDGAAARDGEVEPTVLAVAADRPSLQGIAITRDGVGLVADTENFAIYSFDAIAAANGTLAPARTLTGYTTGLRNPRKLFLLEP
jgi:hypothetical protein